MPTQNEKSGPRERETEAGWAPAHRKEEEAGQAQDRDAPGAQAAVWICWPPVCEDSESIPNHQTKQTARGSRHHLTAAGTESPKGGNVGGCRVAGEREPIFLRESLSGDSRPRKIKRSGLFFCLCRVILCVL